MKKILIVSICLLFCINTQTMDYFAIAKETDDIENLEPMPEQRSLWGRLWDLPGATLNAVTNFGTSALETAASLVTGDEFSEGEYVTTDPGVQIEVIIRNPDEPPFVEQKKAEELAPAQHAPQVPVIIEGPAISKKHKSNKLSYACFGILGVGLSVLLYKYYKKHTAAA